MEPTKISSPQGTQSAHAARHRSTAQTPDANEPGAGGFLALLAALGDGAMGGGDGAPLDLAASGAAPSDVALSDAAKAAMEASAMAAWQGLLVPNHSRQKNQQRSIHPASGSDASEMLTVL